MFTTVKKTGRPRQPSNNMMVPLSDGFSPADRLAMQPRMTQTHVPAAYAARRFTPRIEAILAERYRLTGNDADTVLSADELAKVAKGADYLVVSVTERVTRAVIEALLPELKV